MYDTDPFDPREIVYRERSAVDDEALSTLHGRAFGSTNIVVIPWQSRLERWSVSWVSAYAGDRLVGFVNVAGDGGVHAFLLDTVVDPRHRHQGIGAELVRRAAAAARTAGCYWLHVDYEPQLSDFYLRACGFRPTTAGLLGLHPDQVRLPD